MQVRAIFFTWMLTEGIAESVSDLKSQINMALSSEIDSKPVMEPATSQACVNDFVANEVDWVILFMRTAVNLDLFKHTAKVLVHDLPAAFRGKRHGGHACLLFTCSHSSIFLLCRLSAT